MKAILSKWMTFRARRIISAAVLSIVLLSVASNSAVAADFKDNNTALTAHIIKLNTGVTLE
jgi:hypothetical protein